MDLLTVNMYDTNKLLSVPVNQVQALGESTNGYGFVTVGGTDVVTKEDYLTLMSMWAGLTGTGE